MSVNPADFSSTSASSRVSAHQQRLADLLSQHRQIPVAAVADSAALDQLIHTMQQRQLQIAEITLRTHYGLEAIRRLKQLHPEWVVAAGTVLDAEQLASAAAAGADFIVSPGYLAELSQAALEHDCPLLPGVMTPSDVMSARRAGHRLLKLFPARSAGGIEMLANLAGPFGDVRFCPTGGINPEDIEQYLSQKNVIAVGASWLAKP